MSHVLRSSVCGGQLFLLLVTGNIKIKRTKDKNTEHGKSEI